MIKFPAVTNTALSEVEAKELAIELTRVFSDVDEPSAVSFLLVGTIHIASKMLPRNVLDTLYAYNADSAYGTPSRHTSNRRPPRRTRG